MPDPSTHRPPRKRAGQAFTLVEALVAMAILMLVTVLVAAIVKSGNLAISGSRKHLSADAEVRAFFSQFGYDLARRPNRIDLDTVLSSSNDALFFFSTAPGFQATTNATELNNLSLVGYRIGTNAQIERLGKGLSWTNAPFLTYTTTPPATNALPLPSSTIAGVWPTAIGSAPAYNNGVDSDYHVVGTGIFRMFYCFQMADGTYVRTPPATALTTKLGSATALVLTVAVLDEDSRKMVTSTSGLADALPSPAQTDLDAKRLPGELWQAAVNNTAQFSQAASIPAAAAARVRIYQRSFPLYSSP